MDMRCSARVQEVSHGDLGRIRKRGACNRRLDLMRRRFILALLFAGLLALAALGLVLRVARVGAAT